MSRLVLLALSCGALLFADSNAYAQDWFPWSNGSRERAWQAPWERNRAWRDQEPRAKPSQGGDMREGGARPEIDPRAPSVVRFTHDYPANSIVIDTGGRKLYYVLPDEQAYAYPISVGREGFSWTGTETISRKQAWPDWIPPPEMRERDPSLPQRMTGGLQNPLGGSNAATRIASSCIRAVCGCLPNQFGRSAGFSRPVAFPSTTELRLAASAARRLRPSNTAPCSMASDMW